MLFNVFRKLSIYKMKTKKNGEEGERHRKGNEEKKKNKEERKAKSRGKRKIGGNFQQNNYNKFQQH